MASDRNEITRRDFTSRTATVAAAVVAGGTTLGGPGASAAPTVSRRVVGANMMEHPHRGRRQELRVGSGIERSGFVARDAGYDLESAAEGRPYQSMWILNVRHDSVRFLYNVSATTGPHPKIRGLSGDSGSISG